MKATKQIALSKRSLFFLAAACAILLGVAAYFTLPDSIDWGISYRPATLDLIAGKSPYGVLPFFNPPWVLLPLIPFAVLPFRLGVAALFTANFIVFVYICHRVGARLKTTLAFMCSFPVMFCLLFGQIDGLIMLGLFLPRSIGLIFLLSKPQIGAAVAVFWAIEEWRSGGWKPVVRMFIPVAALYLISFAIYGLWPLTSNPAKLIELAHNTSIWPLSLSIGLPLLIYAIRRRKQEAAEMSAPFFSPYVTPSSWSMALLGLIPYEYEMIAASIASWVLGITRLLHP